MNKFFDNIFYINLDRRKDRQEFVEQQLKRVGLIAERVSAVDGNLLDPDPKIGNGWNHKGVAGCALSHRKVIQLAKERGYKNFLVIEDDTVFSDDFNSSIGLFLNQLPVDWDMIYFGGNYLRPPKPVNVNIGRCTHTLTTNMYAMKETLFDYVLNNIPDDVKELKMPVDVLYTSIQLNSNFNCYAFRPQLVWQDSIFSDIENKSQDLPYLRPNKKKVSLIISSFNQRERLRYSLKSAIIQDYNNYEVIVADDGSTDGTKEMVEREFPGVLFSSNPDKEKGLYTLALNWNAAATLATGERLIFTNADCIFPKGYVKAHADEQMFGDIIFGPNERTDENMENLLKNDYTVKQLLNEYIKLSKIGKDLRHDSSAYTYNKEYSYYHPWGNNMSVPTNKFREVGGFPQLKKYGGEEILLSKKLCTKKGLKVKSNVNTLNIHLWHLVTNSMSAPFNEFLYNDYINS